MNEQDLRQISHDIQTVLLPVLRSQMTQDVEACVNRYRRALYVRDEWCCADMTMFANKVWNAPRPHPEGDYQFGDVTYRLRGRTVNFCPFCGVSFNAPRPTSTDSANAY